MRTDHPLFWSGWRLRRAGQSADLAAVRTIGLKFYVESLHPKAPRLFTRMDPVEALEEAKAQAEAWAQENGL